MNLWERIMDRGEYGLAAVIYGIAAWSFANGDVDGGWVSVIIGTGCFVLLKLLKYTERYGWDDRATGYSPKDGMPPPTFEEGEMRVLMSKGGVEPVPIPGEFETHARDCHICKRFKETL